MKRPTTAQIKAARDRVRSKGSLSDDVQWLSVLAASNPECADCTEKIANAVMALLDIPPARKHTVQGLINGAFIAGLHIGLEVVGE